MARLVKEEEYTAKRNKILDVTLTLVYSLGYEKMTIQDILDALQISRGALYHYFESKQALLEALVERMGSEAEQRFLPVVHDPKLPALEKFRRYFEASARWKTDQKTLIISLLHIWYSDDNALMRQKMTSESIKHIAHLLEPIIRQGLEEKVFTARFPEQTAKIVASITLSLSDSIIELLLAPGPNQALIQEVERILEAYVDTLERILGAPSGSLNVFELEAFKALCVAFKPASESE